MRLPNQDETLPVRGIRREVLARSAVAGGIVALSGAYLVGVVSRRGRGLDQRVARSAARWGAPVERPVHALIAYGAPLMVVIGLAVVAVRMERRGDRAGAVRVVGFVVVAEVITQVLKLALPRPGGGLNTLPSGHVTLVSAFVVVIVVHVGRAAWAVVTGSLAVGASAIAVIIVGWHRPSDVVAAVGVVAVCAGVALLVGGVEDAGRARP